MVVTSCLRVVVLAAAFVALMPIAKGQVTEVGEILIQHPWGRPTVGTSTPGAGYMVLENRGSADDRLVSAQSPIAETVTMHRTEVVEGIARMLPQHEGIVVRAGETIRLEPGSYHLMLTKLREPMVFGQKLPLSLTFERAGTVTVELVVERFVRAAEEHEGHHAPE